MRRTLLGFVVFFTALAGLLVAPVAEATPLFSWSAIEGHTSSSSAATTSDSCFVYQNHVYEVCTAYLANSSLAVLLPYYKFARDPNTSLSGYVTYRLGQRYTGAANSLIQNRVAAWPVGDYDVGVPDIHIVSVTSSLAANRATLKTEESWTVTDSHDHIVYRETHQRHVVSMQRVPSYILHKWVVTDIR
jgi:hypothetical protein